MTIEEEIARTLAEWRSGEYAEPWEVDMYMDAAAALSPLLNRVRVEAIRDAARVFAEGEWVGAFMRGEVDDDVTAVQATGRWLNARADRIEQKSEGNQT